jgi:hypothetical protein
MIMAKRLSIWIWAILSIFFLPHAEANQPSAISIPIGQTSRFTLATAAQGRVVLGRIDEYIRNQTAWERGARMNKIAEVAVEDYVRYCQSSVLDWNEAQRRTLLAVMKIAADQVRPYAKWMPPEVLIVRTNGAEDYGSAYTRGNAIVIKAPREEVFASPGLLTHELWHVISRGQTELRNKMYAAIGFHYYGPLKWIAPLDRLRVTNPDCPVNEHTIKISYQGHEYMAMPIMHAKSKRFGLDYYNDLRAFLDTHLLLVQPSSGGVEAVMVKGEPSLVRFNQVNNFKEQIGYNTNYLDHPEEIIADNFELLVSGAKPRSPEITARLKEVLMQR